MRRESDTAFYKKLGPKFDDNVNNLGMPKTRSVPMSQHRWIYFPKSRKLSIANYTTWNSTGMQRKNKSKAN